MDLVAEEDVGNSHLFYIPSYLNLYNDTTKLSNLPLWLHTGETNWPDDLISSNNPTGKSNLIWNTYIMLSLLFSFFSSLLRSCTCASYAAKIIPLLFISLNISFVRPSFKCEGLFLVGAQQQRYSMKYTTGV